MEDVVKQIRAYLAKTGKKQYELAAEIGAPVQTVNRWLTGKTNASHAYLIVLKSKGIL
jgi:transcriptional regulator with XRE-family HTH domain